ncbi:CHAT domain-containing protein [bacterium]|nr:CHAT domain-containing protein [bacterium]
MILVLDGVLHYLPFETLITNEDGLLIQDFRISYAPSATIWANLRTRTKLPNKKELAAFADPVLNTDSQNSEMSETSSNYHLQRLRYSRNEVQAIAALYPKDLSGVYLAQDATEAKFKSERISDYKVIHFATHAVIDDQIPRRSGVILSPDEKNGADGILQLYELRNLNLNAQLVVLSACQTGLGKLVKGEGIVGLMRAFFSAGARNVVVSLWNVDDKSTAQLMKNFYKHMKNGKSRVESLRQAKLDLLQSAEKGYAAYKAPYYWSPFVLVGSGE